MREDLAAILKWMETLAIIPGTKEYVRARVEADRQVRGVLDKGGSFSDQLQPLRDKAREILPDVILDESHALNSPQLLAQVRNTEITDLLPSKGFFHTYLEYTKGSIAPVQYDFLSGLNVLGAWKGRTLRMNIGGRYYLFAPCSVMLISLSPGLGKGIALRAARTVLLEAGYKWIAPDRLSASMFLGILHDRSKIDLCNPAAIGIMASELAGFFRDGDQATAGLIMDLADLMDMPDDFEYATRRHGHEDIHWPTVSMHGCSNMDWLTEHMPREAFTGGFFPRQYISVQAREHAPKLDMDYPPPPHLLPELVKHLHDLNDTRGEVRLTAEAISMFIAMRKASIKAITDETDERKRSYYDRKPTNVVRMAMLLAASEKRVVVRGEDINAATTLMGMLEETHHELYNRVGLTKYGRWRQITLDLIFRGRKRGVHRKDLKTQLQPLGLTLPDFEMIISDLVDSDLISSRPAVQGGVPTTTFFGKVEGTKDLTDLTKKDKGVILPFDGGIHGRAGSGKASGGIPTTVPEGSSGTGERQEATERDP